MKEELILKAYEVAKERYTAIGVDVDKAMEALQKISLSLHCGRPMTWPVLKPQAN